MPQLDSDLDSKLDHNLCRSHEVQRDGGSFEIVVLIRARVEYYKKFSELLIELKKLTLVMMLNSYPDSALCLRFSDRT